MKTNTIKRLVSLLLLACFFTVSIFSDNAENFDITEIYAEETDINYDDYEDFEEFEIFLGDIDFDGEINTVDLILLAKHLAQRITLDELQLLNADVHESERVNSEDLIEIIKHLGNREFIFTSYKHFDSDGDRLTDYDELKRTFGFKTDPKNPDTDGDGVDDGDEIELKLDPTNPKTHGYSDNEYTSIQKLNIDNPVLSLINTDNEFYKMSIEMEATGWAESSLDILESRYSYAISNYNFLDYPFEVNYNQRFNIKSFTLSYVIIDNEILIDDLSIFKYYEDVNMILPVETEYDYVNNTISVTTDELGTYCLIYTDIWLNLLEGAYLDQQEFSGQSLDTLYAESLLSDSDYENSDEFEVSEKFFKTPIGKIVEIVRPAPVFGNKGNQFTNPIVTEHYKYQVFDDTAMTWDFAKVMCEKMGGRLLTVANEKEANTLINYVNNTGRLSRYWIGATKSSGKWQWIDGTSTAYADALGWNSLNLTSNLYYSKGFIYPNSTTPGYICKWNIEEAYRGIPNLNAEIQYPVILPHNNSSVFLDDVLNSKNGADTDGDGITDWEEADIEIVKKIIGELKYNENDGLILPTREQYVNYMSKNDKTDWSRVPSGVKDVKILPIKSSPTAPDTDGDKLPDNIYIGNNEKNGIFDWVLNSDEYLNVKDPNPMDKDIVLQWSAYYENGEPINRLQSCFGEVRSGIRSHFGNDFTPGLGRKENCTVRAAYDGVIINMVENSYSAGYYIEIEHKQGSLKFISRYLHLENFSNSELYKKWKTSDNLRLNIKKGDILGIVSGTPYGTWSDNRKTFTASVNGKELRYGKHLHFDIWYYPKSDELIVVDPLLLNRDKNNNLVDLNIFVKVPKNLVPTCGDNINYPKNINCQSCVDYWLEVKKHYNLAYDIDVSGWGQ